MNNKKDIVKEQRIIKNPSLDKCDPKIQLLQSSLKWRDIQKTLHWLGRILASNHTNIERCYKKKDLNQRSEYSHTEFYSSKATSKKEKPFKKKKMTWMRNLRNNSQTSISSNQSKKFRKEHKKRYWKNHSKEGNNKSKRKEFQHGKKYKESDLIKFSPTLNTTILKPNSVLLDFENMFFKKKKHKGNNFLSQKCDNANNLVKIIKNCELKKDKKLSQKPEGEPKNHTERWSSETKLWEQNRENKTKLPKQKPWPHFVYHRVSSNFLHPELTGQNHGKSAYIAISVVNGDKSDSTDNNNI